MIRTSTDPRVAVRNPVISAALDLVDARRALYIANPTDFTRYQLVAAERRLVAIWTQLGFE